jgi:nifR3 family TIM-barrel protein
LLKDPLQVAHVISAVRKAVSLPLTVKIRSGWRHGESNAVEIARIAEDYGVDGVIVHPRAADQGFSGKADWDIIAAVKQKLLIPVIGSGDIRTPGDALRMLQLTGCDGIMIGRGVLGNPWVISGIISLLAERNIPSHPSFTDKEIIIKRHMDMEMDYSGERAGSRNFRKHLLWYTKGLPGGAGFRKLICTFGEKDAILRELHYFFQSCEGTYNPLMRED